MPGEQYRGLTEACFRLIAETPIVRCLGLSNVAQIDLFDASIRGVLLASELEFKAIVS